VKKWKAITTRDYSLFTSPLGIEDMLIGSPLFNRSSGRFLVKLYVPFVIDPVVMPTIEAEVMVGAAVDVHMIK
jgi:hypothetical protein